jgi:hypothetical protein
MFLGPPTRYNIITLDTMGLCLGIWEHPERQVSWRLWLMAGRSQFLKQQTYGLR